MKLRILRVVLPAVLFLMLAGLNGSARAATSNGFSYETINLNGQQITMINGYTGSATSLTLPATLGGKTVTAVWNYAFSGNTKLTHVTIPSSYTIIMDNAFARCTSLTSVTLSEGLKTIEDYAFIDCTALTSINLPDSLVVDEAHGFNPFGDCAALSTITVKSNSATFKMMNGGLFSADGKTLYCVPRGFSGRFDVPSGVETVGRRAFLSCYNLTSVSLPDSLTSIGMSAFGGCRRLSAVSLPGGLTSLGNSAFSGCERLTSVVIPESVDALPDSVFYLCSRLESVDLPSTLVSIGARAFFGCGALAGLTLPDHLASIGDQAFPDTDFTLYISCRTPSVVAWAEAQGFVPAGQSGTRRYELNHTSVERVGVPATCEASGLTAGTGCAFCGAVLVPQEVIPALGHDWGEPVYTWAQNNGFVTACRVCARDEAHAESETAEAVADVAVSPTEADAGEALFTAAFTNDAFETQHTARPIPPLGELDVLRLPADLSEIGPEAFASLSCQAVIVPAGCDAVGQGAFRGCENLIYVRLPESLSDIAPDAFEGCGLVLFDRAASGTEAP